MLELVCQLLSASRNARLTFSPTRARARHEYALEYRSISRNSALIDSVNSSHREQADDRNCTLEIEAHCYGHYSHRGRSVRVLMSVC